MEEPDLVITDIMMPEMTGNEGATEISKMQTNTDLSARY